MCVHFFPLHFSSLCFSCLLHISCGNPCELRLHWIIRDFLRIIHKYHTIIGVSDGGDRCWFVWGKEKIQNIQWEKEMEKKELQRKLIPIELIIYWFTWIWVSGKKEMVGIYHLLGLTGATHSLELDNSWYWFNISKRNDTTTFNVKHSKRYSSPNHTYAP